MEVRPKKDFAFWEKSVSGSGMGRTEWEISRKQWLSWLGPFLPWKPGGGGSGGGISSPFLSCEPLLSEWLWQAVNTQLLSAERAAVTGPHPQGRNHKEVDVQDFCFKPQRLSLPQIDWSNSALGAREVALNYQWSSCFSLLLSLEFISTPLVGPL